MKKLIILLGLLAAPAMALDVNDASYDELVAAGFWGTRLTPQQRSERLQKVLEDWGLSGLRLGYLLSAGLVGMAIGSLFIAPWADRFGRRPLILVCIAVAGAGMLASSQATGPGLLAAFRFPFKN